MIHDVKDVLDSRQITDGTPTEDIFINGEFFSDTNTKDTKNLVDIITQETDVNNILFDHVPIYTTPNVAPASDPSLNFLHILLPKNKRKNAVCKKKSAKSTKKLDKKRKKQKN